MMVSIIALILLLSYYLPPTTYIGAEREYGQGLLSREKMCDRANREGKPWVTIGFSYRENIY